MSSKLRTPSLADNARRNRGRSRAVHTTQRWLVSLAVIAGLVTLAPRTVRAQQLSVDQIEVFLKPGDPAHSSAVFNVSNEGATPVQALIYTADWDRDSVGGNRFFPTGTVPASCRDMVQIFPAQMQLQPHTQQPVRVTLNGADTLHSSCWDIVMVEMRDPVRLQQAGRSVSAILRLGTKVYVEPQSAQRSAELEDMSVVPHYATPQELADTKGDTAALKKGSDVMLLLKNTGGLQIRVSGTVQFKRPDNTIAATGKIEEVPLLPGAVRRVYVPIPTLASGKYIAIGVLDFGGEAAGGQVEIDIP